MKKEKFSIVNQDKEFEINTDQFVTQSDVLITGKQALGLNSAKLVRAAIMQINDSKEEIGAYRVGIDDLSQLLGVSSSNLYRDVEKIVNDILHNPVEVRKITDTEEQWIKIPWVSRCEYNSNYGISIRLNQELRPYLIGLKNQYTQYVLGHIMKMKSVYGIRVFEMIQSKIYDESTLESGLEMEIDVDDIRISCDCIDKYPRFSNFRARVIAPAVKEINELTEYNINYEYIKNSHHVAAIRFLVQKK